MIDTKPHISQLELLNRLQKLMFLRVFLVSLLLGASILIQVKQTKTYFGDIQTFHYFLIATIYFFTFVYAVLLRYKKHLIKLAYTQLLLDTVLTTTIIYATGGAESVFSFLYFLAIISASILLYRKGGLIVAASSSILYGILFYLYYYNVIQPFSPPLGPPLTLYSAESQGLYTLFNIIANSGAFFLVAFLSSFLSEQARKGRVELKAKQNDIETLEALNERIIRSIISGVITIDDRDRVILFNPAAEDIFAVKPGRAIGKQITEILPFVGEYLDGRRDSTQHQPRAPHPFIDLPYVREDGKKIFLRFSISPLKLPNEEQKGKILFFQDMTEVRQIEEEMKKVEDLALIGQLAAGIAHEIRNPMASISGSIQMLSEGLEKDDVNNRLMGIILTEIGRLNHLISDFLLFARPKPSNLKKFDLYQLTSESVELFRNSENWHEKMQVTVDFKRDIVLESDPEQIKQILWNLLLNACEAMPEGGMVHVSADVSESGNHSDPRQEVVKVSVRDTGDGFTERALLHLFTPFFTTKERGSGLGLATVKRILDGLKGKITGQNHPDGGAEITILLQKSASSSSSQIPMV
jgi:two-component system sensor histidine kinase PilS (NtrC family)